MANDVSEIKVTPCVGVWIETLSCGEGINMVASHPAWVCGLKPPSSVSLIRKSSHTLRGCVD